MIDWTKHTISTSRDPERRAQRDAIAFLNEAQGARIAYDNTLHAATAQYGDGNGVAVSGVYRSHFPEEVKVELRHRLHMLNRAMDNASWAWGKTGRRNATFLELCSLSRRLPDGRVSYY